MSNPARLQTWEPLELLSAHSPTSLGNFSMSESCVPISNVCYLLTLVRWQRKRKKEDSRKGNLHSVSCLEIDLQRRLALRTNGGFSYAEGTYAAIARK